MPTRSPRRLATVLGIAVSAVFIWVAVRHLDVRTIVDTWQDAAPWPWVPLAILAYVVGHLVRGARLRFLVRREAKLPLSTASNVVVVGYASNNVLPARLGELVRAGMLAERTGIPLTQALTVTFVERVVDGVAILFLFIAGTWATHAAGWIRDVARVGTLVFGIALLALGLAVLFPRALTSVASRLVQPLGPRWHDRAMGFSTSIVNGVACLRDPKDALVVGLSSSIVWLLESAMFLCVLPAVGLAPSFGVAVVAMSVTNLGILVPSTPGFIGPFHFFCSQALQTQGVSPEVSLAYAVLVHLAFYVPATSWGTGAMLWYGVEVGATAMRARGAKRSPGQTRVAGVPLSVLARVEAPRAAAGPSPFELALTEALLPEGSGLTPAIRHEVATFVAGQLDALPASLRALYWLGMSGFRAWVLLRYLQSFRRLSPDRRRRAVAAWAFGPIAPLRQLFRAPRSTALVAFYDHPEIIGQLSGDGRRLLPLAAPAEAEMGGAHG